MRRRELLAAASVGIAVQSGCLSDDGARTGDEALVDAENAISDAAGVITSQTRTSIQLDITETAEVSGIYDALQTARNALHRAQEVGDDSVVETASFYLEYIPVIEIAATAIDEIDTAFALMDVADQYSAVEEYGASETTLEEATDHLEVAVEHTDDAVAEFEEIQQADAPRKPVDDAQFAGALEAFYNYTVAFSEFTEIAIRLNSIERLFEDAFSAYEEEEWDDSLGMFWDVEDELDELLDRISAAEDAVPSEMVGAIVELRCSSVAVRDAAREMEFAVLAAQEGDHELQQESLQAALDALEGSNRGCEV